MLLYLSASELLASLFRGGASFSCRRGHGAARAPASARRADWMALAYGSSWSVHHRVGGESARALSRLRSSTMRPGMPTTVAPAGTSFTTTAFEPTRAPSPTVKPPSTFAPAPTTTPAPSVGWRLVAAIERGAAERHALVDGAVVADFRGLADHHAHAVVDEHAPADLRAGMDLDAGEPAADVRGEAPEPAQAVRSRTSARACGCRWRAARDSRSALPRCDRAAGSRSRMQAMSLAQLS